MTGKENEGETSGGSVIKKEHLHLAYSVTNVQNKVRTLENHLFTVGKTFQTTHQSIPVD